MNGSVRLEDLLLQIAQALDLQLGLGGPCRCRVGCGVLIPPVTCHRRSNFLLAGGVVLSECFEVVAKLAIRQGVRASGRAQCSGSSCCAGLSMEIVGVLRLLGPNLLQGLLAGQEVLGAQ